MSDQDRGDRGDDQNQHAQPFKENLALEGTITIPQPAQRASSRWKIGLEQLQRWSSRLSCSLLAVRGELIVGLLLVGVGYLQYTVYMRQTDFLVLEQRAQFGAPRILVTTEGNTAHFVYIFKNIGHSATKGFNVKGDFIIPNPNGDWLTPLEQYCDEGHRVATIQSQHVIEKWKIWAVVPNEEFVLQLPLLKPELESATWADLEQRSLVGCITYGQSLPPYSVNRTGFYAPFVRKPVTGDELKGVYAIAPN